MQQCSAEVAAASWAPAFTKNHYSHCNLRRSLSISLQSQTLSNCTRRLSYRMDSYIPREQGAPKTNEQHAMERIGVDGCAHTRVTSVTSVVFHTACTVARPYSCTAGLRVRPAGCQIVLTDRARSCPCQHAHTHRCMPTRPNTQWFCEHDAHQPASGQAQDRHGGAPHALLHHAHAVRPHQRACARGVCDCLRQPSNLRAACPFQAAC